MFQRDFIMRQIEQLGIVVQRILKLVAAENWQAASFEIEQAGSELLGIDFQVIRHSSPAQLLNLFTVNDVLDLPKCLATAELLRMDGALHEGRGQRHESASRRQAALHLFLAAVKSSRTLKRLAYDHKIRQLVEQTAGLAASPALTGLLVDYWQRHGQFSKADDLIFDLAATHPRIARKTGIALLERLLQKTDAELLAGNLPREEVQESLAELRALTCES